MNIQIIILNTQNEFILKIPLFDTNETFTMIFMGQ